MRPYTSDLKNWNFGLGKSSELLEPKSNFSDRLRIRGLLFRSWWVVVFCTLCVSIYFQSTYHLSAHRSELFNRFQEMKKEKITSTQERDELVLRLQSESDPAWIETILMKELGVVPEGWIKVQFKS